MIELLASPENIPFLVALCVLAAISAIEAAGMVLGFGLFSAAGQLFDGVDLDGDVDHDLDGAHLLEAGVFTKVLGWLMVGRVPVLILLVLLLTGFGLGGLSVQLVARQVSGAFLPAGVASIPAFAAGVFAVRSCGAALARIIPKDETTAVSSSSFVGRTATLTAATARAGLPAEAKLRDGHGQTHYVLVEPDAEGEVLEPGSSVLLVRAQGSVFRAIKNTNAALS